MGMPTCGYVAKGEDDDAVVSKMMEHLPKAHPDKLQEMSAKMSEDEIKAMFKEHIKEE